LADSVLLTAAATQLRVIQGECADEKGANREQRLSDVLRQVLEKVLPQDRRAFLEELRERFPVIEESTDGKSEGLAPQLPQDPISMTQRLLDGLAASPGPERAKVADMLRAAGLAPAATQTGEAAEQLLSRMRQVLGLGPTDNLDAAALSEVTAMLIDFVDKLDPFAWRTWRALTPRAGFPRAKLKDVLRNYVKGQKEAPAAADLTNLRKLTAALLNALQTAPTEFFQRHLSPMTIDAIKDAAHAEGKAALEGWNGAYWRKYEKLSPAVERKAVESAFGAAVFALVQPVVPELVLKATEE
jgi:hypothetical protein